MGRATFYLDPEAFMRLLRGGALSLWRSRYEYTVEGPGAGLGQYVRDAIPSINLRFVTVRHDVACGWVAVTVDGAGLPEYSLGSLPENIEASVASPLEAFAPPRSARALDLEDGP